MHLGNTPEEIELRRQLLLMRFFVITGNLVMVPLFFVSVIHQRWSAAIILALMILVTLTLVIKAHLSQRTLLVSRLLSISLWVFTSYLMISGGYAGTGIYFAFSLLVLMIMLAGLRFGAVLGLGYLAAMIIIQALQPDFAYQYPISSQVRLQLATAFLVLLLLIAEWIHLQSYVAIKLTVEKHQRNSLTDPLTALVNRAGLESSLEGWTDPQQQAAVALIDIDHFKQINDQYGHATGDKALATLAKVLRNNVKQNDIVCRWGGEEFVVVFEQLTLAQATEIVDQLRELLAERTFSLDDQQLQLQFSAGVAEFKGEHGFSAALRQADSRVYIAKRAGRNRVVSTDD